VIDPRSADFLSQDLVGVLSYKVPLGNYKLNLTASDNNLAQREKSFSENIVFNSFDTDEITISDIELCSNILKDGANPSSLYFKNGLEAVPNPKSIYGSSLPVIFYYSEIYNKLDSGETDLKLKRIVHKNEIITYSDEEKLPIINGSIVKVGLLNVSKFVSGGYTLSLNIVNSKNQLLASSSKKFYIYNPNVVEEHDAEQSLAGGEFDLMNEDECDYNFEVSKYIAAPSEVKLYDKLTHLDAKRKFLYDFWKRRDADPKTASNEVKVKYMEKVDYVNNNFGNKFKEGYKTDRGRVILLYGMPDRTDSFNSDSELKPYEIWYYDSIESGVMFVFGDTMGGFDYELLHSTKLGEIRNQNWGDRLSIYGRN
ncbi:MAG: GWxTD domain-containing protein, partial [Ignavibacteriae bacterium]|nr:GWxTD domain-containing protein [Ignavibacteriota bacterium]